MKSRKPCSIHIIEVSNKSFPPTIAGFSMYTNHTIYTIFIHIISFPSSNFVTKKSTNYFKMKDRKKHLTRRRKRKCLHKV